ncbi:MAG: phosphopantothenoylcysteine decarboxylase/phosphopantothenate--cysteine ligase [Hyphomicrobiaceae bacterium]|jgi:phosphopantothenoylcysteine decarboxylase/phosphopantothenate--cysteine ligase
MSESEPKHRILLIITGGIAAYKCLELIRRARDRGIAVRCVMTKAAQQFVTPLSVGALTNDRVFTDLFDLNDEREIGHIRLSREAGLVVVAPASADFLAKMAGGHADDLASSVLLATDKPVLVAPAMNSRMWAHPATVRNVATLTEDGISFIGPGVGEMAESGEAGAGRMSEPHDILDAIQEMLEGPVQGPLQGLRFLITAGPTHEPIDPVRYIANRSSGQQGYAIATAAARLGADVTLVSGPTGLAAPDGVETIQVEAASDMLAAVEASLPADIAVFTAAVADWRVDGSAEQKIKKGRKGTPQLKLVENADILATVSQLPGAERPQLVIGFAAETEHVIKHATAKLARKSCDWIVANDVSPATGIMGGAHNEVHLIKDGGSVDDWPRMAKDEVADRLVREAGEHALAHRT